MLLTFRLSLWREAAGDANRVTRPLAAPEARCPLAGTSVACSDVVSQVWALRTRVAESSSW